jgi:hypothetical protein
MSASSADAFPMDGFPFPFVREFIDANGGEAAFEGLTSDEVKDRFIKPQTQATKLYSPLRANEAGSRCAYSARDLVREPRVEIQVFGLGQGS